MDYNIFDLGFSRQLLKTSYLTPLIQNDMEVSSYLKSDFLNATNPTNISSGEMISNVSLIDGYYQSSNFVTGSAGWRISGDGDVEFSDGVFRGTITATTGTIGGFSIGINALTAGANTSRISLSTANGIHLGANSFASAPFRVANNGAFVASNANITGSITANSGVIGGFTIGSDAMYGGVIKTALNVQAGATGVIMDTAGLRGYDTLLGEVFNLPTNGSAPTFASGIINNTIFNISENSVIRTSSTVGDGTANSAGVLINNTGIYACGPSQLLENANIKLLANGSAVIQANIKGGQTDFLTGTGFFLGLSGGAYKFSVGSPDNFLSFDGELLKVKGSFDVGATGVINNAVYLVANLPVASTVVGFEVPSAYE